MINSVVKPSMQGKAADSILNRFLVIESETWARRTFNAYNCLEPVRQLKTDYWWNGLSLYMVAYGAKYCEENENERA